MSDTIDWGLQLLTQRELKLFTALGVISSFVPLELVEGLCAPFDPDPLGALSGLVDRSMVRRTTDGDRVAFGMLELLRQHAGELLERGGLGDEVRNRHAEVVAELLDELRDEYWSDPTGRVGRRMEALMPEIRTAFEHACHVGTWELAGRIVGSLTMHRHRAGGHAEQAEWLDRVRPHVDEFADLVLAHFLFGDGFAAWYVGDHDHARAQWRHAADLFELTGQIPWLAFTLVSISVSIATADDTSDEGAELARTAVEMAHAAGLELLVTCVVNAAGERARTCGEYDAARMHYEEALASARSSDDLVGASVAAANLSYIAGYEGRFEQARELGRLGLRRALASGRRQLATWSIIELARPATGLGEHRLAARLVGAGLGVLTRMGGRIYPPDLEDHRSVVADLVAVLGSDEYERQRVIGHEMSFESAVALALGDDELPADS